MSTSAYKFPDETENGQKPAENAETPELEIEAVVEGDVELDIVDDTPPEDRGRKPMPKEPDDVTDEELAQYTSSVQKRIKDLTHARHDERRAKEAIAREREELERLSQQLIDENKRLKAYAANGEKVYAGTLESAAKVEIEVAKKKYKEAHEAFDADALLAAQEELLAAQMKLRDAQTFKTTSLQEFGNAVENEPTQAARPQIDEKTLKWQQRNPWFGSDDEMTAIAMLAHKKLVQTGVDPRSDEYFERIDARVRKMFPEFFGETEKPDEPAGVKKAATVVAPANRSTGTKKVSLTKTQVAIAKRLGVPLNDYAKQVQALEASNG
jgi:hypothetical protein